MGQQRAEMGWSEEKESLPLQEEELAGCGKGLVVGVEEGRSPGQWPGFWLGHPVGFSEFSSVAQLCPTLRDPMHCSKPGFPVHHHLPELAQTHVHRVGDAIQPSHPLSSPSPPAFNLSQHQSLVQGVSSSHQVVKILELQLQHQSFQ